MEGGLVDKKQKDNPSNIYITFDFCRNYVMVKIP